jgi:hypothetical protein
MTLPLAIENIVYQYLDNLLKTDMTKQLKEHTFICNSCDLEKINYGKINKYHCCDCNVLICYDCKLVKNISLCLECFEYEESFDESYWLDRNEENYNDYYGDGKNEYEIFLNEDRRITSYSDIF